jgi:hypothetical protein
MSRAREVSKARGGSFSSTEPTNPVIGQLWTDNSNANSPSLKVYNGTEWKLVSGASGGGGMKTVLMTYGAS